MVKPGIFGLFLASITLILLAPHATAQDAWLGKKVFLKEGVRPRLNDKEVDRAAIAAYPATVTGVDGKKLLVGEHWVYANEVLTLEQQATVHRVRAWAMSGRREFDAAHAEYEKSLELNPNDPQLFLNRGQSRLSMKLPDLAIQDFTEMIRLAPRNADGYSNRASTYLSQGNLDAAIKDYSTLIEINPKQSTYYFSRASALKRKGDLSGELRDLNTTIELYPKAASYYSYRGKVLQERGELDAALVDFEKAIELLPTMTEYYDARAAILRKKGDDRAAKETYKKLVELRTKYIEANPENPTGYNDRGYALRAKHDFAAALQNYSQAIELNPSFAMAYNNRAWLRATCPAAEFRDGQQAIADATKACELTNWRNSGFLDALAAAYAEVGDFDKAVEWETKALDLFAEGQTTSTLIPRLERSVAESRLKLYRERQPFRTE